MPENETIGKHPASAGAGTVVVARFSALGDVAMTVPVLYALCRSNPETRFVVVTKKPTAGIFVNPPGNLEVFGADMKGRHRGFPGIFRLFADIRRLYNPTAFVDLHDVTRTKLMRLMARLAGIRVSVFDKGRAEKKRLVRLRRRLGGRYELPRLTTTPERYATPFERLGYRTTLPFEGIFPGGIPAPVPLGGICDEKKPGERWIAIAPFAAHRTKVYPPEMMEQVIAMLTGDPSTRVFLFGAGETERDAIRRWTSRYPRTVSMAEQRHGFGAEFNLLRRVDLMLSMDSANMHLARLVGVPTLSVWGPTHVCCGFGPWNQGDDMLIGNELPCRPCSVFGNLPCRLAATPGLCMRSISPEMIVGRIDRLTRMNNEKQSETLKDE
ncbi:MAG: glycosyltransferase family 9 protein [Clostridium sp.]|nr:glycosyltransferase family 9 protein [Clostridium sp.]